MKKIYFFSIFITFAIISLSFNQNYSKKFLPKTFLKIGQKEISVSNLTINQAKEKCQKYNLNQIVTLTFDNQLVASSTSSLNIKPNCKSLNEINLKNSIFNKIRYLIENEKNIIAINLETDYQKNKNFLKIINQKIYQNPKEAVFVKKENLLYLRNGQNGINLQSQENLNKIKENLEKNQYSIKLNAENTRETITNEEKIIALNLLKKVNKQKIILTNQDSSEIIITPNELVKLHNPIHKINNQEFQKISKILTKKISIEGNDAIFKYNEITNQVENFKPETDSVIFDKEKFEKLIISYFDNLEKSDDIKTEINLNTPIIIKKPEITLEKINHLGIKEEIGYGESYFLHSTKNRVYNVDLAAKKIDLTIIKPNEEFFFNKTIGKVEKETGFKKALVIKSGATVSGYGGGVCQVSSTLFRTVLNAGLPITKRLNHAYRVGYYEQKSRIGMDATVYTGNIDFRFINDTRNPIMIYTESFPKNFYLKIRLFGTSDNRKTEIVNFKKYNYVQPLEPTYVDDPEKPIGYLEQVENAIPGITSKFTNIIRDENENIIREDKYVSRYKAWGARYIRGTKP
jgi:vancomycin resistance protein YoaR